MLSERSTARRVTTAGALVSAMLLATFLQFALGTLAPLIMEAFGLSRARFGLLTTAMFVVAALLSPATGHLVDSLGATRLLVGLFLVIAISHAVVATAAQFSHVVVGAALGGVGLSAANPSTNRIIVSRVLSEEQGSMVGVAQSGVPLGAILAAMLPTLAATVGWRLALSSTVVLAMIGLALLATSWILSRPSETATPPATARGLTPGVGWLVAFAVLMGLGQSTLFTYLPLYAYERAGFDIGTAGLLTAVFALAGFGARIIWGHASGRVTRLPPVLGVLAAGSAVSVFFVLLADSSQTWSLWLGAAVFGATGVAWPAVGMLLLVRRSEGSRDGPSTGIVYLGFYSGLLVSPPTFGAFVDHSGSYVGGWWSVIAVFGGATLLAALWAHRERGRDAVLVPVPAGRIDTTTRRR